MTKLPQSFYNYLGELFEIVEISAGEQTQMMEKFEEELFNRVMITAMQKLPEAERVKLAKASREEFIKSLREWINEEEVKSLFDKQADELFKETLMNAYKQANEEQKEKIEALYKPEVLKTGIVG